MSLDTDRKQFAALPLDVRKATGFPRTEFLLTLGSASVSARRSLAERKKKHRLIGKA
jgi:hypothetical protein